jgi:hypothetical protein
LLVVVEKLNGYTQDNKYGVKDVGQVGALRDYSYILRMFLIMPYHNIPSDIHPHSCAKHHRRKSDQQNQVLKVLSGRVLFGPLDPPEIADIDDDNALSL